MLTGQKLKTIQSQKMSKYEACKALRRRYWAGEMSQDEFQWEVDKLADKQVHFNFEGGQHGVQDKTGKDS